MKTNTSYMNCLVIGAITCTVFLGLGCTGGFEAIESNVSLSSSSGSNQQSVEFSAAKKVLSNNCYSSHDGSMNGVPRFNFTTEQEFISAGLIVAGQPDQSKLIQRLKNFTGTTQLLKNMPPSADLTSSQYSILRNWVRAAKVASDSTNFTCNTGVTPENQMPVTPLHALSNKQLTNTLYDFISYLWDSPYRDWIYGETLSVAILPAEVDARFSRTVTSIDDARLNAIFKIADYLANRLTDDGHVYDTVGRLTQWGPTPCPQWTWPTLSSECQIAFIKNTGLRLYRRPLLETADINEVNFFLKQFEGVSTQVAANNIIMRMMMSPNFLYQMEDQETVSPTNPKVLQLSSYAIANRLSYTFWNSMPDQQLLTMAKDGLNDDMKFVQALEYVIANPKTEDSLREFANGWLYLKKTAKFDMATNGLKYFSQDLWFDDQMRKAMIDEVEDLFAYVTKSNGKLSDVFTSDVSFARYDQLMKLYGVTTAAPQLADMNSSNEVHFPAGTRSGVLTRAALLADAGGMQHPIRRAVLVKRDLMCLPQTPPPADTTPPDPLTDEEVKLMTTRQQIGHITGTGTCFSCHQTINQFGYALSRYNGLGFYKDTEAAMTAKTEPTGAQLPIDTTANFSGILNGVTTTNDAIDYSAMVGGRTETQGCFTKQYANYFLNRQPDAVKDGCRLNKFDTILGRGGSIKDALRSLASDPEFKLRKLP